MASRVKTTFLRSVAVIAAAGLCGLVFNLAAPQGIGWLPRGVAHPQWESVSLSEALELRNNGALLVDARDSDDYKLSRVRGAVNISPLEWKLLFPLLEKTLRQAPALVIYGRYFSRWPAAEIAQKLKEAGIPRVLVADGRLCQLAQAGAPLYERNGRKTP